MSKDDVKKMFGGMEKDERLREKYSALMRAHAAETDNALCDRLIELGAASGFAFSKDDLLAARAELIEKYNSNAELSAGDLEKVAGGAMQGKIAGVIISICTFGAGCAIVSVVHHIRKVDGCQEALSTSGKANC